MHWVKYFSHIRDSKRDRSVMASVLLHVLGGEHAVPFDVSALRSLSDANRWATNSFLDWHLANRNQTMGEGPAGVLKAIIRSPA